MSKKLGLVLDLPDTNPETGKLYINRVKVGTGDNDYNYQLCYLKNDGSIVGVSGDNGPEHFIWLSELKSILSERWWNHPIQKYVRRYSHTDTEGNTVYDPVLRTIVSFISDSDNISSDYDAIINSINTTSNLVGYQDCLAGVDDSTSTVTYYGVPKDNTYGNTFSVYSFFKSNSNMQLSDVTITEINSSGNESTRQENIPLTKYYEGLTSSSDLDNITNLLTCTSINDVSLESNRIIDHLACGEVHGEDISRSVIDVLNQSRTFTLVSAGSDIYTNTVSFAGYAEKLTIPGRTGKIELTIQYSMDNNIYTFDTTFEVLKTTITNTDEGTGVQTTKNFIQVLKNVTIECINNVIRVVPSNPDVDECIISNCFLTYGII